MLPPVLEIRLVVIAMQFIYVALLAAGLLAGMWVFVDARRRRMPDPMFWALIVMISVGIGLLIYITLRPRASS